VPYAKIATERRGDVGVIRLNDPATLNAVSVQMIEELTSAIDAFETTARAILIIGTGRAFSSGANLGEDTDHSDFGLSLEQHVNPFMTRLRDLSIPWISAVRGAAAGVGCSLALAADLVVASETAYFLQAFARIALVPDGGSSYLLARTIGRARAMEMMLLGDRVSAAKALDWGLISRVTPDGDLETAALELAERLANGPTKTFGLIRKLGWAAVDADWPTALKTERQLQQIAGRTPDCKEAIAAFREKRAARFTGQA
jgi:2-(1,2-epoxy-1,2-dihydrophenyl)acetyl-CoA isomerase